MSVLWVLRWNQMGIWLKQWDGFCEDRPAKESLLYPVHQIGALDTLVTLVTLNGNWKKRTRSRASDGNSPAGNAGMRCCGSRLCLSSHPAGIFSSWQARKGPERSVGCIVVRFEEPAAAPSTPPVTPQCSCCSRTTVDAWWRSCDRADGLMGGPGKVADPPSSEEQVGSPATTAHAAMQTQEAATRGSDEELDEGF